MPDLTLYDVYPFSAEPLPDFSESQVMPTPDDQVAFADVVNKIVAPTSSQFESLWLPEGILMPRYDYEVIDDREVPLLVSVRLVISRDIGDPEVVRSVGIEQVYSIDQLINAVASGLNTEEMRYCYREDPFTDLVEISDEGVDYGDEINPSIEAVIDIVGIRASEGPSSLSIQPGTMTDDIEAAAMKGHGLEVTEEMIRTGELQLTDREQQIVDNAPRTACSQRTLQMVTQLLGQYT